MSVRDLSATLLPKRLVALALASALAGPASASGTEWTVRGALPSGTILSGTILNGQGHGVAAARVELLPIVSDFEVQRLLLARRAAPEPIATTTSSASGRFALEAPGAGVFRVAVRAEGFVPMRFFTLPLAESRELPPVVLSPAISVPVRVLDERGEPLPGATVIARSSNPSLWSERSARGWRLDGRFGWTDEGGNLTLLRARGERLDLSIFSPGLASAALFEDVERAEVTVATPAVWRRRLEVRDPHGEPAPNVMVALGKRVWPMALTDSAGQVELVASDTSPLIVHVLTEDGQHQATRLEMPGGESEEPAIVLLEPVARVAGRVQGPDGRPVRGALVWPAGRASAAVLSDSAGRFAWRSRARPEWTVQARAPGFLPYYTSFEPGSSGLTQLDLELAPAAAIRGRVVDASGTPVAGVDVEAIPISDDQMTEALRRDRIERSSTSDAAGRFEIRLLDPAGTYQLAVAKDGFTTTRIILDELRPHEALELSDLRLQRGRRLFGRVLDLEERPIAQAEVRLRGGGLAADASDSEPPVAHTDHAGRFELVADPGTSFDLLARARGFAPFTVRGVRLPPGRDAVDLGTLILAPGVTVHGVVQDAAGKPLAGAEAWMLDELPENAPVRTPERPADAVADAEGRFEIPDLEAGRQLHLLADLAGFLAATSRGVEAPTTEPVVIVLGPASTVQGVVVDSEGQPVPRAEVSLRPRIGKAPPPATPTWWLETVLCDDRGRFVLQDVAPGPARIEAFAEGFQPGDEHTLEIARGATLAGLRLVLERGSVLEGWITSESGEALEGARVSIARASSRSDADGRYRVTGVAPGSRQVDVRHPGFNRLRREIAIEDEIQYADFELTGGHRIAGRAVDDGGVPIEGVHVRLLLVDELEAQEHGAVSEADGSFAWPRVADGRYRLLADKEGLVAAGLEVEMAGEPVDDLEIELREGASVVGRVLGLGIEELARLQIRAESLDHPARHGEIDYETRYSITDLAPGDWSVLAWIRGGSRHVESRVAIASGVAEVTRDLEFGTGLVLTGRVLYDGEPLAETLVQLNGRSVAAARQVTTDFEGGFRLEDLETGSYRIELVNRREGLIYNEDLELPHDLDRTFEIRASRVTGTVLSAADATPVVDALILMQQLLGPDPSQQASLFTVATDSEGHFSQDRLTSGRYRLTARKGGYEPFVELVDVPAGVDPPPLHLALEPTAGLEIQVRLASGPSPRVATVRLDAPGMPALTEARVLDGAGYARFETLPPGDWQILLSAPGGATTRAQVTIPGPPVEIVLRDAGRLEVRAPELVETSEVATLAVIGQDGRPFRHLSFEGELQQQWSLVGGRATLEGLPAGAWTVQAFTPDGRSWVGSATTTGGPDVEVSLE